MKMMIALAGLSVLSLAHAERWNSANNPLNFSAVSKNKLSFAFESLPLKANLLDDRFGWSDTYWPSNLGGIAYRWNHANPEPFTFKLHTKDELLLMTPHEVGMLSPAELYDIAVGDYNYSLTKKVLRTYSPDDLWWEGICHGWAQAAANYPEPSKVEITNQDGIIVPFGSSDVKGLLSMHDAFNSKGRYVRIGERCKAPGKVKGEESPEDGVVPQVSLRAANSDECRDVNAGAFHVVLTNMIGINSQGFVAEVDRYNDVWNQPVTSYTSEILGDVELTAKDQKSGVSRKLKVATTMTYGEELVWKSQEEEEKGTLGFVSKDPVTGTPAQTFMSKNYEYVLELDAQGNIIGGEWLTETRPDMLWHKVRDVKFINGKFPLEGLNKIYVPVTR